MTGTSHIQANANVGRYLNFKELITLEREGESFVRVISPRRSEIVVVAPHGGNLEDGTSEIARAIAGTSFSLYAFESLKEQGDRSLHITSTRFDDPECLRLVKDASTVITVHGCEELEEAVFIGGRDEALQKNLIKALRGAGFKAGAHELHRGLSESNICNRCDSQAGIQIELSRGIRDLITQTFNDFSFNEDQKVRSLVATIRNVLQSSP